MSLLTRYRRWRMIPIERRIDDKTHDAWATGGFVELEADETRFMREKYPHLVELGFL